jgi:hypothetical protein
MILYWCIFIYWDQKQHIIQEEGFAIVGSLMQLFQMLTNIYRSIQCLDLKKHPIYHRQLKQHYCLSISPIKLVSVFTHNLWLGDIIKDDRSQELILKNYQHASLPSSMMLGKETIDTSKKCRKSILQWRKWWEILVIPSINL